MNKGDKFKTRNSCILVVEKYVTSREVHVRFLDRKRTKVIAEARDIKNGCVRNPNHPSIFGIGYVGVGSYSPTIHPLIYSRWYGMFQRCYNECYQKRYPSYVGCTVCKEWHCFQNFCEWYLGQKYHNVEGMDLDKDILKRGNKIYSPRYCRLVPYEINYLLLKRDSKRGEYLIGASKTKTGKFIARCNIKGKCKPLGTFDTELEAFYIYKEAKEAEIKRVAKTWKKYIDKETYKTLMTYKVKQTD